ncbi:MAG: NAD(P)H-quinone oxidoreductase [Hyphomicrobiales bacterium]|nr:NAD(P)H-quinone oxidoreductase [Hyphomicrobiales bacterium]
MTDLPETMTAIGISGPGGPEVLMAEERPVPRPADGEVLVKVAAAGVNRPDVLQRLGHYPPPPGAPDIPGLEIAGTVAMLGRNAGRWQVGDKVTALVPGGGYAQYCTVHETNALTVPQALSFAEAACVPETVFTVWHNLFQRGGLTAGETVLVHGGTSGIGTTAIQLARAFGAKVIVTAGSDAKCRAAEDLGADKAVNYRSEDFVEVVRAQTDGAGVDIILDMVGGDYIGRNYEAAAEEGRIVQIAFLKEPVAEVDFRKLMVKRLTHTGSTLRPRSIAFKADLAKAVEEAVWPLIADGRFRPVMDSEFALAEAAEAHRRIDDPAHIGKIVLTV